MVLGQIHGRVLAQVAELARRLCGHGEVEMPQRECAAATSASVWIVASAMNAFTRR